jgi:hypothetical protein
VCVWAKLTTTRHNHYPISTLPPIPRELYDQPRPYYQLPLSPGNTHSQPPSPISSPNSSKDFDSPINVNSRLNPSSLRRPGLIRRQTGDRSSLKPRMEGLNPRKNNNECGRRDAHTQLLFSMQDTLEGVGRTANLRKLNAANARTSGLKYNKIDIMTEFIELCKEKPGIRREHKEARADDEQELANTRRQLAITLQEVKFKDDLIDKMRTILLSQGLDDPGLMKLSTER